MAQCPNINKCPKQHLKGDKGGTQGQGFCTTCSLKLSTIEPEKKYSKVQIIGAVLSALVVFGGVFWAIQQSDKPKPPVVEVLFTLSGSNTIGASLMPELVEQFLAGNQKLSQIQKYVYGKNDIVIYGKNNEAKLVGIAIKSAGSSSGFQDMRSGKTDLIMSSRPAAAKDTLSGLQETVLCNDALAIVVHAKHSVHHLDKAAIANLFAGATKWTGLDKISIHARNSRSGTWELFEEKVLKPSDKKLASTSVRYEANDKLVNAVSKDSTAIGFSSYKEAKRFADLGDVKILGVSDGHGSAIIYPNETTIKSENYPLTRRLFLYTNKTSKLLSDFKAFALSDAGQGICEKQGFFGTISTDAPLAFVDVQNEDIDYPDDYLALVQNLHTMPYNIRFEHSKAELDTKALQDAEKTIAWFEKHKDKKALLIGFADATGSDAINDQLSASRAWSFKKYLTDKGVSCDITQGFGSQIPVGDNSTEDGRAKNRRVEIWVK
jgi:phosphate transport system substrate-binding protein